MSSPPSDTGFKALPRPTSPLIRICFFFTRHPSMTQPQFEAHWRDTHGQLALASKAFSDAKIQKYVQNHNDKALSEKAAELGLPLVEFEWDACSEMYVKTWEDYLVFATSEEARDLLGPDGALITDPERGVKVMVTRVDPLYIKSQL